MQKKNKQLVQNQQFRHLSEELEYHESKKARKILENHRLGKEIFLTKEDFFKLLNDMENAYR